MRSTLVAKSPLYPPELYPKGDLAMFKLKDRDAGALKDIQLSYAATNRFDEVAWVLPVCFGGREYFESVYEGMGYERIAQTADAALWQRLDGELLLLEWFALTTRTRALQRSRE